MTLLELSDLLDAQIFTAGLDAQVLIELPGDTAVGIPDVEAYPVSVHTLPGDIDTGAGPCVVIRGLA